MKIAVIGANGFIGSELVKALRSLDFWVNGIGRGGDPQTGASHVGLDARQSVFDGCSAAFYLAISSTPASTAKSDITVQVDRFRRAIDAAQASEVATFVFLSSGGAVYGEARSIPIDESHPTTPFSAYGELMLRLEETLNASGQNNRFRTVILRASNVYGRTAKLKSDQGVVEHFASALKSGAPMPIRGSGSNIRDFLHISDMVRALVAVAGYQGPSTTLNIGTGVGTSIEQLGRSMAALLHVSVAFEFLPPISADLRRNVLASSRAAHLLGWRAEKTLYVGLREFLLSGNVRS